MIIETEAYLGIADPASHAWRGRRHRLHLGIWSPPGHWYVYRSHGLHWCLNLTCGPAETGAAVLIRALEVRKGLATVRRRRGRALDRRLTDGPGKLCQALAVTDALDGTPALPDARLRLEGSCDDLARRTVVVGPRVGISRAVDWPMRFRLVPAE